MPPLPKDTDTPVLGCWFMPETSTVRSVPPS